VENGYAANDEEEDGAAPVEPNAGYAGRDDFKPRDGRAGCEADVKNTSK
jgi:hypothetical protein